MSLLAKFGCRELGKRRNRIQDSKGKEKSEYDEDNHKSNHVSDTGKFDMGDLESSSFEERLWSNTYKRNYSDWTISIALKKEVDDEDSDHAFYGRVNYYVHKTQLASGRRRCEYFRLLFAGENGELPRNNTTVIEFENESALLAFPTMLDFLYSKSFEEIPFTSNFAIALRFLAYYFGIKELYASANKFISKNLSHKNAIIFLKESYNYRDETVLDKSSKIIAEKFDLIGIRATSMIPSEILMDDHMVNARYKMAAHFEGVEIQCILSMTPKLLELFLSCGSFKYNSKGLSLVLCRYFKYRFIVDPEIVISLTSETVLPEIDHSCAFELLDYLESLSEKQSYFVFKSLFTRCIRSLQKNWRETLVSREPITIEAFSHYNNADAIEGSRYTNFYRNIQFPLMVDLLKSGLVEAKESYVELSQSFLAYKYEAQEQTETKSEMKEVESQTNDITMKLQSKYLEENAKVDRNTSFYAPIPVQKNVVVVVDHFCMIFF